MAAHYEMDEVFRALADPSRRKLLDSLGRRNGQTLRELCSGLDMARQSVSKHLAVLEEASLVTTVRRGREKLHYLNAAPIGEIGERWISRYDRGRVYALTDLKHALEEDNVDKPEFVYTTYIRTTPQRLWRALTDPAFTDRYWGVAFETDWNPGSPMTWRHFGLEVADPDQLVLEAEPFRLLSYTWHSFTDEVNDAIDLSDETRERIGAEQRSRVTFHIEPFGELVKLTVVHETPGPVVGSMVSKGWPRVLSNLKTLLETGELLPENPEPIPPVELGLTHAREGGSR